MSSNIKDPPKSTVRPSQSSRAATESVKRGAQLFQEKLRKQQNMATKNKLKKQIRNDSSGVKSDLAKSKEMANNPIGKCSNNNSFDKNRVKGKSYKSKDDRQLREPKPEEVYQKKYVYDTKIYRPTKTGFMFRNHHRLGSDVFRKKRSDRIHSVEDSDEEEGRGYC